MGRYFQRPVWLEHVCVGDDIPVVPTERVSQMLRRNMYDAATKEELRLAYQG